MNWLNMSPYLVTGVLLLAALWINVRSLRKRWVIQAEIRQAKRKGLPIESIAASGCSSCSSCRSCPSSTNCSSKR